MINLFIRALRRARLRIAEQDLQWMETIGQHNIARQRAQVAELRRKAGVHQRPPITAADIAHQVARRGWQA